MLILPAEEKERLHKQALEGVTDHFNVLMERILNENSHKELYWILGKASKETIGNKQIVRPFLQASDEKPGLVKESFVYEVDNRRGVKTLLWVMYPGDMLHFPTLGKTICVAGKKGGQLISSPEIGRLTGR